MTRRARKRTKIAQEQEYPYISFRPSPIMEQRLRGLSRRSGQSIGALIRDCVAAQIDKLESQYAA